MGVALDELLGSVIAEADREAAIITVILDFQNGSYAVGGMADASADEAIWGAMARRGIDFGRDILLGAAESRRGLIIVGIRLVAALFAGFGDRAGSGFNEISGNFS